MAIYRLPPSPFVGGRQPLAPKDLIPIEVVADQPPLYRVPISAILRNWQESTISIQIPSKIAPQLEPTSDYVPYIRPQLYVTIEYLVPQLPRRSVITSVVQIDNPPFGRKDWLTAVLSSWRPITPAAITSAKFSFESAPDNPPFGQKVWLNTVLNAWNLPIPAAITGVSGPKFSFETVDNPPFGRRVLWLNTVMDAWIPPPPMPMNPNAHITPPVGNNFIIWLWKRVL